MPIIPKIAPAAAQELHLMVIPLQRYIGRELVGVRHIGTLVRDAAESLAMPRGKDLLQKEDLICPPRAHLFKKNIKQQTRCLIENY